MPTMTDEALRTTLRERGQRVTPQRVLLLRELAGAGHHLTADELLLRVSERLPALSAPTVYATLELFEELALVRRISGRAGPAQWEPVLDGHHHFACRRCGQVTDLPASVPAAEAIEAARRAGHEPAGAELVVSGICGDCRAD